MELSGNYAKKLSPEENLLVEIIKRAVLDASSVTDELIRLSARRWLRSNNIDEWSFLWICDQLELSTNIIDVICERAKIDKQATLARPRLSQ